MATILWQDPWYSIDGKTELQDALDSELRKEMPPTHILARRPARAIGRRCDNDDVLFLLAGGGPEYAVVHLTWRRTREKDAMWPATRTFADAADVMANCIELDAVEYQRQRG